MVELIERFLAVRTESEERCQPLLLEDYSVQPAIFASPPKWHLAHITWFWEAFVLTVFHKDYQVYHEDFSFLFNSYYNNAGKRVLRPNRGLMTRPSVDDVIKYRKYVTDAMVDFLKKNPSPEALEVVEIGIHHEQQHQELLVYDIKYILGNQPTFPVYGGGYEIKAISSGLQQWIKIESGIYEIGHGGKGFCFDNELGRHKVYQQKFEISNRMVTNGEYLDFIKSDGYGNFNFWHDEGWQWVSQHEIKAPLYWHLIEDDWYAYNLTGLEKIDLEAPVKHISFYEAFAYAEFRGMRLPTEFEWEISADKLDWGMLWEWTNSAYLPYPGFSKAPGALGEYNGKFMVNQMVLRGASVATPKNHARKTYRNFFQPDMRWQFGGIRLVK